MRILITNDDGIDAPGLALLREVALRLSNDVWTVAPDRKWTAASHHLTFDRMLTLEQSGEKIFACSGTPADGIVAALTLLLTKLSRPGLVLSGINDGENVGEDAIYSGTIAAAREAVFAGLPAIALSRPKDADVAGADAAFIAELIGQLWLRREYWTPEQGFLSINLPKRLPAPLVTAFPGRAKIASRTEQIDVTGGLIRFRHSRTREIKAAEGDQASELAAGLVVLTRLSALSHLPMRVDDIVIS